MESKKINNNPAIAEKLFTEIFVNNNLKNEHKHQSNEIYVEQNGVISSTKHESNVKYMKQEFRGDNDVNILIYANRSDHSDRQKKLTFHDVLISELTENQNNRDYNNSEYKSHIKYTETNSSCTSTASTINIAEWQGLAQRRKINSNYNLNTENMKQCGQMGTTQKHQHR